MNTFIIYTFNNAEIHSIQQAHTAEGAIKAAGLAGQPWADALDLAADYGLLDGVDVDHYFINTIQDGRCVARMAAHLYSLNKI